MQISCNAEGWRWHMPTNATYRKLAEEVGAIERKLNSRQGVAAISCPDGFDVDQVVERHLELFPEDRQAEFHVVFKTIYEPGPNGEPYVREPDCPGNNWGKMDAAWRSIARELRA